MNLSTSGYVAVAVILGAPVVALVGFVFAAKRRSIHVADLGTLVLPPLLFVVVWAFREQLQTGWAMIIWPIVIVVVALYALGLKLLAVDRYAPQSERASKALLAILTLAAVAFALSVTQWLD